MLRTTVRASPIPSTKPALADVQARPKSHNRKGLFWPLAGFAFATIVATNPFYQPHLLPEIGAAAWIADMALVLIPSIQRVTGRVGILLAGLFFAVPCF